MPTASAQALASARAKQGDASATPVGSQPKSVASRYTREGGAVAAWWWCCCRGVFECRAPAASWRPESTSRLRSQPVVLIRASENGAWPCSNAPWGVDGLPDRGRLAAGRIGLGSVRVLLAARSAATARRRGTEQTIADLALGSRFVSLDLSNTTAHSTIST